MTLPGFEHWQGNASGLVDAATKTIEALRDDNLLTDAHALTVELIMSLAQTVGRGLNAPKISIATTNLARLLTDLLDKLPAALEADDDELTAFKAALMAAHEEALKSDE